MRHMVGGSCEINPTWKQHGTIIHVVPCTMHHYLRTLKYTGREKRLNEYKHYTWVPSDFSYVTDLDQYSQKTQTLSYKTRWRSWLRHCTTSRKVAGSIADGVIGIFHWHNPSGRTMALGSTQPLTEMSTRNISFMCRFPWNLGASTSWNTQGLTKPVQGLLYCM